MWIEREIQSLIQREVAFRPVVVLTGARQTGKTSLVRRLFPEHRFVSPDLPREAEQAEHELDAFLRRHPPPVFWRDRSKEVDFLFHRGGRFQVADAKWTESPTIRDCASLEHVREALPGGTVGERLLICRTRNPLPIGDLARAVPLQDIPESWA